MNHFQFSSVFGVYFCPLGGEGGSRVPRRLDYQSEEPGGGGSRPGYQTNDTCKYLV